ncbi:MAG TPA: alpha/beta fold hydrolase [Longimicrobiales bacterium]|nr:alpha/beta fold hydrolase [Longimicrobiales bacterium]
MQTLRPGHEAAPTYRLPRRAHLPPSVGVPAALTLALFLLGPRAKVEEVGDATALPADLEAYLAASESMVPGLREGDGKAIVWRESPATATPVSLVYVHGFSADRHELDPVPERLAEALGANLFFTRLTGHGRDGAAMAEASAGDWLGDVGEAVEVGARIGERVVLLGTSTGGTLAAWAALQDRLADRLAAVVLVSPNLGLADPDARLLLWPWGGLIARALLGTRRCFEPVSADQERHWTTCYPPRALVPMAALVERVRTLDPSSSRVPALVLYSPEDGVVDPEETERFFERYGGSPKRLVPIRGSGDPASHVLAGDILSPQTTEVVVEATVDFLTPLLSGGGS